MVISSKQIGVNEVSYIMFLATRNPSKGMKVLILSQFFSTTRGGGEYVLKLISKKLAENGHQVYVITNKISNEKYESYNNIQLIFVPPILEYKGGLPPSSSDNLQYSFNAFREGLKIIKKEKIDLIHSNNFSPALTGSFLSWFTSTPHVTSIWDIFSLCGKDYWQKWVAQLGISKIHKFIGPKFEKLILRLPHTAIHTISDASKDDLLKFGATKPIHVIFPTIEDMVSTTEQQNSLQFVCVGRLVFYKNIEIILGAISVVKKTKPKIKLVIIGGGPHKKTLEVITKNLEIESNVEFKDYVNAGEKSRLIAQSNALLFPSLCEGFGLVILEAFSQTKPVLVSNVRPLSDIVSHEKTGYVLDPNDENIWAEHILKLAKNPQESERMGKNGNELLKTKYNQDLMYEKVMKMYNDVLSQD